MNHPALQALQAFTQHETVDLAPGAAPPPEATAYPPLHQYTLALSRRVKPETAAEGLFRDVLRDVLNVNAFSQVNLGDGFVDFLLPEVNGHVLVELKPGYFYRPATQDLRRQTLRPQQHIHQVRKYLHRHEYVVLTDLNDAYLFSARDTLVDGSFFARMTFAELLAEQMASRSLLDVMRRTEDRVEKPDLDRQFFADLKEWYGVFETVSFTPAEDTAELIILLINKLVFAKTLEDHGLVPYRYIQDTYERQKSLYETKGPRLTLRSFLREFEEFFDEYYDTELFARKVWDHVEQTPENLARFLKGLELVLGVTRWDQVFSRGIVHYNYRQINEDILQVLHEGPRGYPQGPQQRHQTGSRSRIVIQRSVQEEQRFRAMHLMMRTPPCSLLEATIPLLYA